MVKRSGQAILFLLMALTVLVFILLLNIDLHRIIQRKDQAQNAGDAAALAARLSALQADGGHQLAILRQACQARAPLFAPERERQAVQALAIHLSETK